MTFRKKKGQEEIVGFVLIVVIIAIAFVIFLGIKLRNPEPVQKESEILYQFIESSMEQTTSCVIRDNGKGLKLNELIRECHSFNNLCLDGKSSCETSQETIESVLRASWKVGENDVYKGYEFVASYKLNSTSLDQDEIISIKEGNCSSNYIGNSYLIPEFPGSIVVQLKLCS